MIKILKRHNVAGFSLVELMVVVAIIGILASVAIPNFQRFQRKARQSEARALLSGLVTAQEAFRAEWESYTSDLPLTGFAPTGTLGYHVGIGVVFAAVGYQPGTPEVTANNSTAVAAVCAGACMAGAMVCAPPGGMMTQTTFQANSCGNIGGAMTDQISVTEQKVFATLQDGIP